MRTVSFAFLVALTVTSLACAPAQEPPLAVSGSDILLPRESEAVEATVPSRATLVSLLRQHEVAESAVARVVDAAREVFDLRRLRAGQPYRLVRTLTGQLREFHYEIDGDQFLRIVGSSSPSDEPEAAIVPFVKHRALVAVRGTIDSDHPSLIEAVLASGEGVELAINLAQIFAGEIDFNSDLQPGDSFQMLFETVLRSGDYAGYGSIVAAEFVNNGRRFSAYRFHVPGEEPGYYDEDGRSLKRMFLKSPLPFAPTITSRFSNRRLHPVLRVYRAHLGVDYRAPTGTPVIAVANGTVVSAGVSGGSGRMVRLRHTGGYETYYLHLSAIAKGLRRGARVAQGQMIGRVGSSGLASGPHLDYRVRQNGRFVNPQQVHRNLPPGDPVPTSYLVAFRDRRDQSVARLFSPPDVLVASSSPAPTLAVSDGGIASAP